MKCSHNAAAEVTFSKVVLCQMKGSTVTHTVTIKSDNTWDLHVLGRKLNASKFATLKSYLPTVANGDITGLLTTLNELHICSGHPDKHFIRLLESRRGQWGSAILDDNCDVTVDDSTYTATVRHINCELIVAGGIRCNTCKAYRSTLRALYSRYIKQKSRLCTSPRSHVNIRYLRTPERQKRFRNLKAHSKAVSRKLANLKSKISNEMALNSVQLDEQLTQDMTTIMDECSGYVEENCPADSFERLFWEQQKKARQVRGSTCTWGGRKGACSNIVGTFF